MVRIGLKGERLYRPGPEQRTRTSRFERAMVERPRLNKRLDYSISTLSGLAGVGLQLGTSYFRLGLESFAYMAALFITFAYSAHLIYSGRLNKGKLEYHNEKSFITIKSPDDAVAFAEIDRLTNSLEGFKRERDTLKQRIIEIKQLIIKNSLRPNERRQLEGELRTSQLRLKANEEEVLTARCALAEKGIIVIDEDIRLGRGGTSDVYSGRMNDDLFPIVIKAFNDARVPARNKGEAKQRFIREAQILAGFNHPNIVRIFALREISIDQEHPDVRVPAIIMPLINGQTIVDHVLDASKLLTERIDLLIQLADGLGAAHNKGVAHRDLKPDNILVVNERLNGEVAARVKLLDFGLGKEESTDHDAGLTTVGVGMGTPGYIAPEQMHGKAGTPADIFSFGVIAIEVLTGESPFSNRKLGFNSDRAPATLAVLTATLSLLKAGAPKVEVPQIGRAFQEFVNDTMNMEPERRIDILEVKERLLVMKAILEGRANDTPAPPQIPPPAPPKAEGNGNGEGLADGTQMLASGQIGEGGES